MYQKEHDYRIIQQDLAKKSIPSLVMLCGEEQFLVDWAKNSIINKYVNPTSKVIDVTILNEDEQKQMGGGPIVSAIVENCESLPLLSEKKIVIVENLRLLSGGGASSSDADELAAYLSKLPDSTILVFIAGNEVDKRKKLTKAISEHGRIYDFGKLTERELISFADKRFRDGGVSVPGSLMHYIIDKTGYFNKESDYNLYLFSNDLAKMIAYAGDDSLTREMVDDSIEGDLETFIFILLDSIAEGGKNQALRLIHNIMGDSRDAIRLLSQIVNHFEVMYSIKDYQDSRVPNRMIVDIMGIKEARLRNMDRFTHRFTKEKLKEILLSAYEIEANIKTGLLQPNLALEMFVSKI